MKKVGSVKKLKTLTLLNYRERKRRLKVSRLLKRLKLKYLIKKVPYPDYALPAPEFNTLKKKKPLRIITEITPPADLSLRRNSAEVIGFMQHLRHWLYNGSGGGKRLTKRIDFTKIERISPSAALVLAAELDRWQSTNRMKLAPHQPENWNPEVATILNDLGLFDLLEIRCPEEIKTRDSSNVTKVLKYIRQKIVDPTRLGDMLVHLTEIAGPIAARNFMYDGLIEALKNAKHHAYIEHQWYGVGLGTSWMTGAYNPRQKRLTAAVFDCGVGIPQTLPSSSLWSDILPLINTFTGNQSSKRIAAALKYGRTRTMQAERGNGLPTMMRLIDQIGGELRILSGNGEVVYKGQGQILSKDLPGSLGGTLIEWRLEGTGEDDD